MNLVVDRRRLGWPLTLGAIGLGLAVAIQPSDEGATICPFALVTGRACPGCGLTRGIAALANGDLATAWRYHPLAWLIAGEIVIAYGWWMSTRMGLVRRPIVRPATAVLAATGLLLVAVWLTRWGAGSLPPV